MGRGISALVLAYGFCWSFLLLPWVLVKEQSLTGAELNQILVSLPAVAILMALIALYRKIPRALVLSSGAAMLIATSVAALSDFSLAPASLELQESVTGLAGESTLGEQTLWPMVFAIACGISALLSVWVATLPVSARAKVDEPGANDARAIWDEQL